MFGFGSMLRLKFYNFLSRKKERFTPLRAGRVGLYTCGPTVYNFVHIGNLRTYIFEDVLRRTLEYAGYRVRHVMNITDIDDKIITAARAAVKPIRKFAAPYEDAFFADIEKLNIRPAGRYPRATEEIPAMTRLIARLLRRGMAYEADGSVYFNIAKFKPYGRLSRVSGRALKAGTRVDADEYSKNSVEDFVLWKGKRPDEPSWLAPFGAGRPGWHIECSAMSMRYLGVTFDIHAGGVDLLFPHHENEIAQSEGATGARFVRYFLEGEHLMVDGEKMSKSLGNIITLRDFEKSAIPPRALRMLALGAHYRSKLNFTWAAAEAARRALERLEEFVRELNEVKNAKRAAKKNTKRGLAGHRAAFERALADDLNTPRALAAVWRLADAYRKNPDAYDAKEVLRLMRDFDRVLGLGLAAIKRESIPAAVRSLAAEREAHRRERNWAAADAARAEIERQGYVVEDTIAGPKVRAAKKPA